MEKYQKRIEGLETELAASKAAQRLAESNDANSSKAVKGADAKAVAALSPWPACEMEVVQNVTKTSKDTVPEEV